MWNVSNDADTFSRLSISEVATTDGYRSTLLETVFQRIKVTIDDCGNSVDTYYKQKRLGKISVLSPWFHRIHGVQSSSTGLKNGKPA